MSDVREATFAGQLIRELDRLGYNEIGLTWVARGHVRRLCDALGITKEEFSRWVSGQVVPSTNLQKEALAWLQLR